MMQIFKIMNIYKSIVVSIFLLGSVCQISLYAAAGLDAEAPLPYRHNYPSLRYNPPPLHSTKREKGDYAESIADDLFFSAGYDICPAKYLVYKKSYPSRGWHKRPDKGIDGLYFKLTPDRRIDHLVVNESKFQKKGGDPKLRSMKCTPCSGGEGKTYQMSWRWIHNAVESTRTDSPYYCKYEQNIEKCKAVCPALIEYLRDSRNLKAIIRTATVMDDDGRLRLYSLHASGDAIERQAADSVWQKVMEYQQKYH
jgi:hypothetical protein